MAAEATAVPGPDGSIEILRDEWGIPHVRAGSAHDAFFGQGFVHAQDRLGQLEYDRRRAAGRWAEVAGRSAVPADVFARRLDLVGVAQREYAALSEPARAVLDAYAAGINAALGLERPLPTDLARAGVTPAPWEPWEANAIFLVRHVVFANWQKKLWRARVAERLGAEAAVRLETDDHTVPLIVPPGATAPPFALDPAWFGPVRWATAMLRGSDPDLLGALAGSAEAATAAGADGGGSNSWVLAGTRTASGRPLLAGDPHRPLEVPGVYVQNHLACPEFDAIGLAFVGVPGFPHFGHNAEVAWCVTNAYGDYQDLFVERFRRGATADRTEVVAVRDGEPLTVPCWSTPNGPVVFGDPRTGSAIAMQSTALRAPSSGFEVLAPMLAATSVDSLREVMRDWVDPVNNLLCADRTGTICYQTVGVLPVRTPENACGPVPGWTGAHAWGDPVPFDDLPSVRDPVTGIIVTANQRIVGVDYPHHLSDGYSRPDRAERILARLAELRGATAADMAAVHRDLQSVRVEPWRRALRALIPRDDTEAAAVAAVVEWDGVVSVDSAGAAVFMAVRDALCRRVAAGAVLDGLRAPLRDEPPAAFVPPTLRIWPVLSVLLAADDPTLLAPGETWPDLVADALTDAVGVLRERLGADPGAWRWGALHRAAPRHPLSRVHPEWGGVLDPPAVEVPGEWDTVWATPHAPGLGFDVTGGSVARYVFDLGDWDASGWIVPLGASGECTDPHFVDQQAAWATGDLVPMRYTWSSIEAAATAHQTLVPLTA